MSLTLIRATCYVRCADIALPRSVSFTDALPRNAMNRVVRSELSDALPR